MVDLPQKLRALLKEKATIGSLRLEIEQISQDGTRKRAYKLHDGQMIESVLMPYEDGRRTACISSQAGCAMGCVFCATGQMGFSRQLTSEEIYEQVARFAIELKSEGERLSNVVMMVSSMLYLVCYLLSIECNLMQRPLLKIITTGTGYGGTISKL